MIRKLLLIIVVAFGATPVLWAQFADCSTGLLQMPTAEMQEDGTFMITNNFLNKHSLPTSGWDYNTFQYGIGVSFWGRMEIAYVCTIFNGNWSPKPNKTERERIMKNQDRHFTGRLCLLREGEFGLEWMPALVVGISDPVTGAGSGEYSRGKVSGTRNGYFNRNYAVFTKHFNTPWGELGAHAGYQFNRRSDYHINAPCFGINWQPVWLQNREVVERLDVIAEYDSRTFNIGLVVSLFGSRFEAMFELQGLQWINFGLRYKQRLK